MKSNLAEWEGQVIWTDNGRFQISSPRGTFKKPAFNIYSDVNPLELKEGDDVIITIRKRAALEGK